MRKSLALSEMCPCSTSFRAAVVLFALLVPALVAAGPDGQQEIGTANGEQAAKKSPTAADQSSATPRQNGKAKPTKRRLITVGGGQVCLDIRQWPLVGKPDAKYVFVEMFDYTCPYCRATHQAVRGAIEHFGDDLAIIVLPVPLDAACNRTVAYTAAEHAEACEIARIAVAVWRVNRKQFPSFHSWLFDPAYRPTAAEALQHAADLVGDKAIRDEMNRPHARNYVTKHVELYERVGSGSLPKILFSTSTVSGSIDSTATLIDMIAREGLVSP